MAQHEWSSVGRDQPPSPILYMDTLRATDHAKLYKQYSFDLLKLSTGMTVLDVGCGTGDDVRQLAQIVGASGKMVGIDSSEAMVTEARKRAEQSQLSVEFRLADAHQLPFPDGTFDRCRADRVFHQLAEPTGALREMIRVLQPGGWIVISETDWRTLVIDDVATALLDKFVNFLFSKIVKNPRIGRQLPNLYKENGLQQVLVSAAAFTLMDYDLANKLWGLERNAQRALQATYFSQSECDQWIETLQQAGKSDRFFGSVTGFGISGQKP